MLYKSTTTSAQGLLTLKKVCGGEQKFVFLIEVLPLLGQPAGRTKALVLVVANHYSVHLRIAPAGNRGDWPARCPNIFSTVAIYM